MTLSWAKQATAYFVAAGAIVGLALVMHALTAPSLPTPPRTLGAAAAPHTLRVAAAAGISSMSETQSDPEGKGNRTPSPLPSLQPGEQRWPGIGADTLPPPAGAVPTVTLDQALAAFRANGSRPDLATGIPDVALRDYSNYEVGPVDDQGNLIQATIVHKLAWVFVFHASPPDMKGGPRTHPATFSGTCDFVVATDATSGEEIQEFQSCQ